MQTFEKIDDFHFKLSKGAWTEEERLSAICISLKEQDEYSFVGDVRIVWADALNKFFLHVFTELYSPQKKSYKDTVFLQLKSMYKAHKGAIKESYYPRLKYEKTLYGFQWEAISNMIPNQYNFLSLDMGLGKTVSSATLSKICGIKRTIIIAPAGVKWNWYHNMTEDWGYDPLYWSILDRRRAKCVYAFMERFVVINYEMIKKPWVWSHLLKSEVGHIIIDECHMIKNHKTSRFKEVKKLIDHFDKARITLLSGTPITNRVNDLFAYFKLCNHVLGANNSYFIRRYIKKTSEYRGKIIGAKNIPELTMRLSDFMIRKKAEECLDLPELRINKYYIDEDQITDEYRKVLEEMYQSRMAQKEAKENKTIMQVSGEITDNIHSLNRILATSKSQEIIKLIDKIHEEGRKVLVFAIYKDALSALEEHYGNRCIKIDGRTDAFKRDQLVQRFKNDKSCTVFLGNVKSGGVGINLVNASDVIFMNFPFTPDDLEQPQKRAHRIGQVNSVNVYYTIVKNSIDQHIYNIIIDKSEDINNTLDKGKKGVINYGNVMNKVFNSLLDKYAEDHNLPKIETNQFEEV